MDHTLFCRVRLLPFELAPYFQAILYFDLGFTMEVTENEDGTITISWEADDPYADILATLTEEQVIDILAKAVEDAEARELTSAVEPTPKKQE